MGKLKEKLNKFSLFKMLKKGGQGALIAGIPTYSALQTMGADEMDRAIASLASALAGFIVLALKNFLKNRDLMQ